MRSTPTQRLANACRAVLLVGALGGLGIAAAFVWWPEGVQRFEAAWRERHDAEVAAMGARAASARASKDRAAELAALEATAERLEGTRQLDRHEKDAVQALHRLVELRIANGDAAGALAASRRLHAIDPDSVPIHARLIEQLLAQPATRAEGFTQLQGDKAVFGSGALYRLPAQAEFVTPAVSALVEDGRVDEARAVAVRALQWPEPRWWSVYWWQGEYDEMQVGGGQPRVRADGVLVHEFAIHDACDRLRFLPPAFASCVLEAPRLLVRRVGDEVFQPLAVTSRETVNLKERGADLWLTGIPDPMVTFALAEPLPKGHHEIRFEARVRDTDPEWLQRLLLSASGEALVGGDGEAVALLGRARAAATSAVFVECFWAGPEQEFAGERRLRVDLAATANGDGAATFAVDVPVPQGVARLRIDLGAGERLHWRFSACELRGDGGGVLAVLDLAGARLVQCERSGDEIAATGDDAQFVVVVPPNASGASVLHLAGALR